MELRRNDLLAEMARDAALERSDFLVRAGEQLERFMERHLDRIREIGGLTLIDDDPDFLAVAPDGTFRSRTRVFDETRGDWISETEVIETAPEIVELYNPSDVFQAFADVARDSVWEGAEAAEDAVPGEDPYAGAADSWAAVQPEVQEASDEETAATALYELALDFQERSQRTEAGLLEQFETASTGLMERLGRIVIVDDDDEQLALTTAGFGGRVIPEDERDWLDLRAPDDIVRFYDPTDVFGDLAEAVADAYPSVAGDLDEAEDTDADEAEDDGDEDDGDDGRS
jgi:hypothetical protein